MKTDLLTQTSFTLLFALFLGERAQAQVNSGSNGSDGALDYSGSGSPTNIVIDMHDHPNGIYQYTYVNISSCWRFSFIPNANNTPVTWLVQSNVVINGAVDVSGQSANSSQGAVGGPGGFRGGNGGSSGGAGQGPGGGAAGDVTGLPGSFGSLGFQAPNYSGIIYGNQFLIPLIGGSGGGGATTVANGGAGGGGGGGAILIAASGQINVTGSITANGGNGDAFNPSSYVVSSGGGSGGAIRLVTSKLTGSGSITVAGGSSYNSSGGMGRVRLDTYENDFSGGISSGFTQGSQFIIIPTAGQGPQLTVTSVGGVPVSASPTGALSTPDAVLSAQQNNPIPIVVHCSNIPLNTQITVSVKPANGAAVSATGLNNTGTLASSTATISINMPRGGGIIYATAATGN